MVDYTVNKSNQAPDGGLQFGRSICRQTIIPSDEGIIIAAPEIPSGMHAAQSIKERFEAIDCKVKILHNPEHDVLLQCKQPVIVIGNLSDSKCIEYMYYKYLSMTDKSYPGKEGYHIRTVIDPFATGHNVIHIGYSDEVGLQKGSSKFLEYIRNPIPYLNDIYYTSLPYSEHFLEKVNNETLPEKVDLIPSIHTSVWYEIGMFSYLTGDMKPFETYLEGWRKMIEISKTHDYLIKETHLYMMRHVEIWRLLEFSGMIPDELRGQIEECLFHWAKSSEGMGYAGPHSKDKNLPAHNHTMFCAISLIYLHDYFTKRYPELESLKEWKTVADDVFYTFNNSGWKPYCDDSSYSNQVTLVHACNYSIFQDEHLFLNSSAKQAAEWIKTIIGQNGIIPSFGDGSVKSPFPVVVSLIFSHYLKDGEMTWLYQRFIGKNKDFDIHFIRLFDSGIEPVELKDSSAISCIPLDKCIYDVWDKSPGEGRCLTMTPPNGPYEACFDKVSIRTGRDQENDDFLLIDGLGSNGIHSYSDAMGILDYTSKGVVWLVEENDYRWPEPENCSILTVAREGYASDIPGYGLMEEQKVIAEGQYYLRMRTKKYNGTDWVREVFLIKGLCAVFHDTIICEQKGEYVIGAHFRTPAKAWISKKSPMENDCSTTEECMIKRITDPATQRLRILCGMHGITARRL